MTALTGIAALLIAAVAAYFSVTGLGLLFSGATMQVIIMASSLEFGKLIAAAFLHNHWKATGRTMRTYMVIGVVVLVSITSAGIFGFLSNAYTQTQISVNQVESRVNLLEDQKERVLVDVPRWENRIQTLSDNRTRQEIRYDSLVAGENWVNARKTTDFINEANTEISVLNDRISSSRTQADSLDQLIFQTGQDNVGVEREIGGFRFIASAFGQDTDTIVKWFIMILIFVFDPFAVILFIAFLTSYDEDKKSKTLGSVKNNTNSGRYEVYGDMADDTNLSTNIDTNPLDINVSKHDEVIEEITNRKDYETNEETIGNVVGLKTTTSGGDVILKPKYKDELDRKGIIYEEIKK